MKESRTPPSEKAGFIGAGVGGGWVEGETVPLAGEEWGAGLEGWGAFGMRE